DEVEYRLRSSIITTASPGSPSSSRSPLALYLRGTG
ncbi:hypothetical protein A2U01_0106706, partial [Trifolium medium]|nr:hypothetical protein [Trifolium medium]